MNGKVGGVKLPKQLNAKEKMLAGYQEFKNTVFEVFRKYDSNFQYFWNLINGLNSRTEAIDRVVKENLILRKIVNKIFDERMIKSKVTFNDVYKEIENQVDVEIKEMLKEQDKKKKDFFRERGVCPECAGQGKIKDEQGNNNEEVFIVCPSCEGTGQSEEWNKIYNELYSIFDKSLNQYRIDNPIIDNADFRNHHVYLQNVAEMICDINTQILFDVQRIAKKVNE